MSKTFNIMHQNFRPPIISGELKQWQPLTISFSGPYKDEGDSNPNPFLDYRLIVKFQNPSGQIYNVPGFFDGDGCGGGIGDIWRVRFSPDKPGVWTYQADFKQGRNLAIDTDLSKGSPVSFHGISGKIDISSVDSLAPGFLVKGRLSYVGGYYLKTLGDGKYWIKTGTDSPENFLAYYGFDGGGSHRYDSHLADWMAGDPDWGGGKGRQIIGSLNYLSAKHVNSIYLLLMNIGGDGKDVWPYRYIKNPSGDIQNDNLHFDISKLSQWEIVFSHAQKKGINLNLVLSEGEKKNKLELDNGRLGTERKLYYREMIARFGHHNAIQWMLCEEYDQIGVLNSRMIKSWAQYIKQMDPYNHPLSVHNEAESAWAPFFGDGRFDLTSYQYGEDNGKSYSKKVEELRYRSASSGRKIAVMIDEPMNALKTDDESKIKIDRGTWIQNAAGQKYIRKNVIYPILLSGGGVEFFLHGALVNYDFRPFSALWDYAWYARIFMENIPYWEMEPADSLLSGYPEWGMEPANSPMACNTGHGEVFAKPGDTYAVYLPTAGTKGKLDLENYPGTYEKKWFNPRTGSFEGSIQTIAGGLLLNLGEPPKEIGEDWVLLIKKNKISSAFGRSEDRQLFPT